MSTPQMLVAALLAVSLCVVQGQIPAGINATAATDSDFFPLCNSPAVHVAAPSTIDMVMPGSYFTGPYNCSHIYTDGAASPIGLTVTFASLTMTVGSWVRVSGCADSMCTQKMFIGYAAPNATLRTDLPAVFIEMNFASVVEPEWFPITINNVDPTCTAAQNDTCVTKFALGCVSPTGGAPMLALDDPCYSKATLQCLQSTCSACPGNCADPNATKLSWCKAQCDKTNSPDAFCAPSCTNSLLGNAVCDPACNNEMCSFDGGDCLMSILNSTTIPAGGMYSSIQATADMNGDGLVSYEEYAAMSADPMTSLLPPLANGMMSFDAANFKKDGGLDVFEIAALGQMTTVDAVLDSQVMMDDVSLKLAGDIIALADMDLNGMASEAEMMMTYGIKASAFAMLNNMGLFEKDYMMPKPMELTTDALAHVIFGVYISLSGRTLTMPPFDNAGATHALVMLLDWNMDGKLNAAEAGMMGMSRSLFGAIDADENMYVSEDELYEMQKAQMSGACAGTTLLVDRETEVHTMAPLTGTTARKCSFLMIPDWFYPMDKLAEVQNPIFPKMGGRRLLAADQPKQVVSSSVVMTRTTGPVPNHHLLAAAAAQHHVARDVHHSRRLLQETMAATATTPMATELDMGMKFNVTNETMSWLVSVRTWDNMTMMWNHKCTGALIHPKYVMVPASCTAMADRMGDLQVVFHDMSHGMSQGVMVHPLPDAHGNAPAALIELQMETMGMTTIQLHDGAGLDLSECKQPVVAVGFTGTQSYPHFTKQAVDVSMWGECSDSFKSVSRIGTVGKYNVCSKTRRMAAKTCFSMDDSILLAPHPENPLQYVLVALKGFEGEGVVPCSDSFSSLPVVYTQVAGALNWILSLPTFGKFPALLLSVETEKLAITDGQMVHVVTGSQMMGAQSGAIETKCSLGGTYYDDAALGSLFVTIDSPPAMGYFESEITFDFEVSGCGEAPSMKPGNSMSQRDCEMLNGCMFHPEVMRTMDMEGVPSMCSAPMCKFTKEWKHVTKELQAKGKAFTGGLGGEALVNGAVEYRQWMCARDWDIEEQLGCKVGPGELACFRFDEMSDKFVSYGRNFDKKIVSPMKAVEGMGKEKKGLTAIG